MKVAGGRLGGRIRNELSAKYGTGVGGATTQQGVDYKALAQRAVEEAKAKAEASKSAALGYYSGAEATAGGMATEAISDEQQRKMMATRRADLGAYGQNLSSLYADPYSGVQAGQRQQIGMGIAGRQANLPIDLELEIGKTNREFAMQKLGYQTEIAGGKASIETAYQYDPGLEYIKSLGYGAGYQGGGGAGTSLGAGSRAPGGMKQVGDYIGGKQIVGIRGGGGGTYTMGASGGLKSRIGRSYTPSKTSRQFHKRIGY